MFGFIVSTTCLTIKCKIRILFIDFAFFYRQAVPESPKYESDEDETIDKQEAEVQAFKGADRVTMEMMDSTDIPIERLVLPPLTLCRSISHLYFTLPF